MPNSVSLLIFMGHLCLSGMWLGVAPRIDTKKTYVQNILDTYLVFENHSQPKSQHNWEGGEGPK